MERTFQHLRLALRALRREPRFTAVVVLTLALGISVNTAVMNVIYTLLVRPVPQVETEGLAALGMHHATLDVEAFDFSLADIDDFAAGCTACAGVAAYDEQTVVLAADEGAQRISAQAVQPQFFELLGASALYGRTLLAGEDDPQSPRVAVLSYRLWQRLGGSAALVGGELAIDARPTTIVGVMPAGFHFPDRADLWFPLVRRPGQERSQRWYDNVLLRLEPGVELAQARLEAAAISERLAREYPASNQGWSFVVMPFRERLVGGDERRYLALLAAAVGLVLLIACVNVTNLMLARESGRERSAAVRLALGSSRLDLIRERMCESFLLASGAGALGALLAAWVVDFIAGADPEGFPVWMDFTIDREGVLITLGLTLVCTFLFGLVPALRAANPDLPRAITEGHRGSTGGREQRRLQEFLVVAQISLALTLLVAAGVVIESVRSLTRIDAGFDTRKILTLRTQLAGERFNAPETRTAFFRQALERLQALPGVEAVAATTAVPLVEDGTAIPFAYPGQVLRDGERMVVTYIASTPELFDVLELPLIAGRRFTAAEVADPESRVVIVDDELARQVWGERDPIGERVQLGYEQDAPWSTVVGVVPKVYYERPGEESDQSRFQIHLPYARIPWRTMGIVLRTTGEPAALAQPVRRALAELDAGLAVDSIRSLEQVRREVTWAPRLQAQLLGAFAVLALVLATLGVYGVMAYVVAQRVPEIGVRMALGADRATIAGLFARRGLLLLGAGAGLGLLGAGAVIDLLEQLVYDAVAGEPTALVGALILFVLGAAIGIAVPTLRATRVEPAITLRQE